MNTNIDGINRFFSSLAGTLSGGGGDPMDVARAGLLGSQQGLVDQQVLEAQAANRARAEMSIGLSGNVADPMQRRKIISQTPYLPDILKGVQGATAGVNAIDPNAFGSGLSNALIGTGLVGSYAQTPDGQARDLQNNLDQQRLANEGALAVAGVKSAAGGSNPTMPITQLDDWESAVGPRLVSALSGAGMPLVNGVDSIDPSVLTTITDAAMARFQQNGGNSGAAVTDAIAQILSDPSRYKYTEQGYDSSLIPNFIFGDPTPEGFSLVSPGASAPEAAPPAPAPGNSGWGPFGSTFGGMAPPAVAPDVSTGIGNAAARPAPGAKGPVPVDPSLGQLEGKRVTLKNGQTGTIRNGAFEPD